MLTEALPVSVGVDEEVAVTVLDNEPRSPPRMAVGAEEKETEPFDVRVSVAPEAVDDTVAEAEAVFDGVDERV